MVTSKVVSLIGKLPKRPKGTNKMNWYVIWSGWLLSLIGSFAFLEGYALYRADGITLSRFVWIVSEDWPPFIYVCGLVVGFLAAHFFWPNQGLK
jgi:hypothetical protein